MKIMPFIRIHLISTLREITVDPCAILEPARVWVQQQTDNWYSVTSQQHEESTGGDSHPHRAQRSSSGHTRISRAVLGGGVAINTLPDNMTRVVEDSGKYYTWRSFGPKDPRTEELWVDMSDVRHGQVRVHGILSNSYKQAVRVALSFDFPFYGHYLRQITIATGGFIFTGDITHRMLTATQYIAPLMANFDPSYSKESTVQYLDNGEVFVVQWERVRLPGKESEGAFTFQAALYKTGAITFSYRDIPLALDVISSAEHPVKAGLSDAFMVTPPSRESPDAQRQTIYEYHRVEVDTTKITSYSAVELTPLPNCLQHDSCELCLSSNQTSGCSWCHVLQRCSDGMDRHRQEWLDYGCSEESKNGTCEDYSRGDSSTGFSIIPEMEYVTSLTPLQKTCESDDETKQHIFKTGKDVRTDSSTKSDRGANSGVIAGIAAALVLLLALILVAIYINYHPTAASPLYLIQRRKSYWPSLKFQKQQPGYTEVEGEGHEKDSIVEAGPC
ncbi:plexin domain-containing protein 1-like [Plectropomus leopardus]|uniref:plexin domain-containing protein 1-like n=1 Tax=Plectropomus leopardus TaxID=160734 RepID=UPI001C4BF3AD|nr:plexin domain-containing protein 1-like [Plectropomus leopardus]